MSAASRAEARRKAILSKGTDRLAKLTSSARGEDHPAYVHDDPPLPAMGKATVENFLGEAMDMPTPPQPSHAQSIAAGAGGAPSAWTPEQQQEIIRAFMTSTIPSTEQPQDPGQGLPTLGANDNSQSPPADDPMAAMMAALSQFTGHSLPGADPSISPGISIEPRKAKTRLQKLMPLIHLVATWALLAYFVLFQEPEAHETLIRASDQNGILHRWSDLSWQNAKNGFGVQAVPFFWAFTTLQLILHSVQIFTNTNPLQPPTLIAMALPHLPAPFSSLILNLLTYVRMGGMLLDDVAGFLVGVGLLVFVSGYLAR